MAMGMVYKCECGKGYKIYYPKARLYTALGITSLKEAEETDKEEKQDGEIEFLQQTAKATGLVFIDGSKIEAYQCECGEVIDLDESIKKQKKGDQDNGDRR